MFQEWLQELFKLCQHRGLTERALYVAELVGDFHDEGFFGIAEYAEVIGSVPSRDDVNSERLSRRSATRPRDVIGQILVIPSGH